MNVMRYEGECQPRIGAAFRFGFLCIWGVVSVCAILIIDSGFELLGQMRWLALGGFVFLTLLLLVGIWPICCTKGFQRWSIRDGVIEYESPTPLLGESFHGIT